MAINFIAVDNVSTKTHKEHTMSLTSVALKRMVSSLNFPIGFPNTFLPYCSGSQASYYAM